MIFINDVKYIRIWKRYEYEKYIQLSCTTSEKNQNGEYDNSSWNVKLVGNAFKQGKGLQPGEKFTIVKGKITNVYNKEKQRSYLNVIAFEIETDKPVQERNEYSGLEGFEFDESGDLPF